MDRSTCQRSCEDCPERLVCHCLGIGESTIVAALTTQQVRTVKDLCRLTGAGDGCMACRRRLAEYVDRHCYSSLLPICSVK
jgi:bacterioferritin-associated ferredoxin